MSEHASPAKKMRTDSPKRTSEDVLAAITAIGSALSIEKETIQRALPHVVSSDSLARYIDHTLLKPDGTRAMIKKLCEEAEENKFASVCVNTCWVPFCSELLSKSAVKVCCVVGFPLGQMLSEAKAFEARVAVAAGAQEVDMVINVGFLKGGELKLVYDDIKAVINAMPKGVVLKVILETCLLTPAEITTASILCVLAGADFVKTSTGFSTSGATVEAVRLMKEAVGDSAQIKAAGGVRSIEDARQFIALGVSRLGTSSGVALMKDGKIGGGY